MAGVNKVILVGNLGKDPEIRSFQNGGRVANFSIATSETWKDKATGERKERTEWHRISVLNENLVGIVERFLKKGSKVYVEGQLETRKYQDKQTGKDMYTTEVVLRPYRGDITLLDSRKDDGGSQSYGHEGGYDHSTGTFHDTQTNATSGSAQGGFTDDEIPF